MEKLRQVKKISRPCLIPSSLTLRVYNMLHAVLRTRDTVRTTQVMICNQEASRSSRTINNPVNYGLFPGVVSLEESKTE